MKHLLLLFTFLLMTFSFGQNQKADSLKNVLKLESNKQARLNTLESLNEILIRNASVAESLIYFNEMASLSKEIGNIELETKGYKYISETYMKQMDSSRALDFAKKAITLNEKNNNLNGYLLGINQLGRVYHQFQDYDMAIETYLIGIRKHDKENLASPLPSISSLYSNLSAAYENLGKTDESIKIMLKSIEIAEQTDNKNLKSYNLYALGYTYMNLENYEKAEKYLLKSLVYSDSADIQTYKYINHHALGLNYSRWNKYDKALHHNKIALDYFRQQNDKLYEFDVLNNTAAVYSSMDNQKEVIRYANMALKVATEINHPLAINGAKLNLVSAHLNLDQYDIAEKYLLEVSKDTVNSNIIDINTKINIYSNFFAVYEGQNKFEKSLKFLKKFKNLNDSIQNDKLNSNFAEIETKYQTEKKEKENLQLKAEQAEQAKLLAQESKRKWQMAGGMAVAFVGLGVFGIFYQRNKKQKTIIENLQKELHHRVKNNLAIIDTFIEVVKDEFDNEAIDLKLTELQNRIDSINEVHKQLYASNDVTNLNLKNYVNTLANNVQQSFNVKNVSVEQHIAENIKISPEKSFPMGLIINEFITNSYKYAFNETGGEINITLEETGNKINLTLSDNGKGFENNFSLENAHTFGIRIMKLLTQQLKGSFHLTNENGVTLFIEFPKS